jgi:hypothetical protein
MCGLLRPHQCPHFVRGCVRVIDAWSGRITNECLERFLQNRDNEIRLIAKADGVPVGIGALVIANSELRAC